MKDLAGPAKKRKHDSPCLHPRTCPTARPRQTWRLFQSLFQQELCTDLFALVIDLIVRW